MSTNVARFARIKNVSRFIPHIEFCIVKRSLQFASFRHFVLLDGNSLSEDLIPGTLGLLQLEPIEIVEAFTLDFVLHALGPSGFGPLFGDLLVFPGFSDHFGAGGEGEGDLQGRQVKALDFVFLTFNTGLRSINQNLYK